MANDSQFSQTKNTDLDRPNGMILIPEGPFLMGSNGWGAFESPVHEISISAYLIDSAPVTNSQFKSFVDSTGYKTSAEKKGKAHGYQNGSIKLIDGLSWKTYATEDRMDHPVVLVSWTDAANFARWAGKRLPTEAEFEKAARGGLEGKLYPWGDEPPTDQLCNFNKETNNFPPTVPVFSYPANGYGLFDMCGNVWNWCEDWFGEDYYANSPSHNPKGPEVGLTKVRRGASFNIIQPFRLRCSNRGAYKPDDFAINIGFRCAKDLL